MENKPILKNNNLFDMFWKEGIRLFNDAFNLIFICGYVTSNICLRATDVIQNTE